VRKAAKFTIVLALVAACGGSQTKDTTPVEPTEPTGPQPQDIVHEYKGTELHGMVFTPEALEWPAVVPVKVKGRMPTIVKQRKKVEGQQKKGKLGINDVHVFVTLLNNSAGIKEQSGVQADIDAAMAMRTEARDLLKALAEQQGDGVSEVTLKRLAAIQVPLGEAEAIPYYEQLIAKFPQSESLLEYKYWLAYFYLRAGRDADAAAVVDGWDLASLTDGQAAYVVAWVKFRARDWAGASAAIATAAAKWSGGGKPGLLRDIELIMSRSGASVEDARAALASVLPPDKPVLMVLHTYKLHEGYLFAGRYELASQALDAAFDDAQDADKITFRYNQADYMFRLGRPAEAAQKIKAAYDACAAWDQCPPPLANAIAERMLLLARVYHNIYATSLDEKYMRAAKVLYELYLGITPDRPDKAEVASNKGNLDQHVENAKPEMGKHAKDAVQTVLQARAEGLQACYESVLQGEPDLTGSIKVTIDVQQDGSVSGVATEPGAGKDGLAAVAGCLGDEIKAWSFPARTVPGLTRLVYPISFSPKADAPAAAPAAGATP